MRPAEIAFFCGCCNFLLVPLNVDTRGKYLAIQLSLATALLLAARISSIHLIDEIIYLFPVILKEIRIIVESKVLSFSVSDVNQRNTETG